MSSFTIIQAQTVPTTRRKERTRPNPTTSPVDLVALLWSSATATEVSACAPRPSANWKSGSGKQSFIEFMLSHHLVSLGSSRLAENCHKEKGRKSFKP